ncbi:MAG: IS66 family transposase zinc-finger binding domain-containing protein [Byssovorax sp.]
MGKNSSEHVSAGQPDLFLEKLVEQTPPGALDEANKKLTAASRTTAGRPEKSKPTKQPPVRRPIPDSLRREDNTIPVPPCERSCPTCGKERKHVGYETTPVIEYKPGEVYVRNDRREVCACGHCDAEMVVHPRPYPS